MPKTVQHLSITERAEIGKGKRVSLPRVSHAVWDPSRRTSQPVDLLQEQAATRVPELVPIRHSRMAQTPFAYFRGAALPMAADLATLPNSGLTVQVCGDAHLCNFGGFASPERVLLFDINDFDETLPGPFEWDLKRLAASLVVAARGRGFDRRVSQKIVLAGMRSYQRAIREFATMNMIDVWYSRLDVNGIIDRWSAQADPRVIRRFTETVTKATRRDGIKARVKLTQTTPEGLRFKSDPPVLVPVRELLGEEETHDLLSSTHELIVAYRRTLQGDRRHLLESYRFVDLARKIVGVGSVGTRCWVALLVGRDEDDTLILQVKEAESSVLERFLGRCVYNNNGQRVVEGQRLMQAASDIFLGWQRNANGIDGRSHDYYIRQMWDWKVSANVDVMIPEGMAVYAQMCGWTLARAHARSGDAVAIGAYIGSSDVFPRALASFANAYADQTEADFDELQKAIANGILDSHEG